MLVLTRQCGESIMIGETRVMVVAVRGGKVKIGIESSMVVHRQEVYDEIQKKNKEKGGQDEVDQSK